MCVKAVTLLSDSDSPPGSDRLFWYEFLQMALGALCEAGKPFLSASCTTVKSTVRVFGNMTIIFIQVTGSALRNMIPQGLEIITK